MVGCVCVCGVRCVVQCLQHILGFCAWVFVCVCVEQFEGCGVLCSVRWSVWCCVRCVCSRYGLWCSTSSASMCAYVCGVVCVWCCLRHILGFHACICVEACHLLSLHACGMKFVV
jgi:hypothetical protein